MFGKVEHWCNHLLQVFLLSPAYTIVASCLAMEYRISNEKLTSELFSFPDSLSILHHKSRKGDYVI